MKDQPEVEYEIQIVIKRLDKNLPTAVTKDSYFNRLSDSLQQAIARQIKTVESTEVADTTLRNGSPALLFLQAKQYLDLISLGLGLDREGPQPPDDEQGEEVTNDPNKFVQNKRYPDL